MTTDKITLKERKQMFLDLKFQILEISRKSELDMMILDFGSGKQSHSLLSSLNLFETDIIITSLHYCNTLTVIFIVQNLIYFICLTFLIKFRMVPWQSDHHQDVNKWRDLLQLWEMVGNCEFISWLSVPLFTSYKIEILEHRISG